jgi:signal transduction histidine kinase
VPNSIKVRLMKMRLSLRAFLIFSPVSTVAVVFADFDISDTVIDIVLELTLGVIATAALGTVLWVMYPIWNRIKPGWERFSLLAFVITLGGAVRGFVIFELGPLFAFDGGTQLIGRVANSMSTTFLWLVILSLFIDSTVKFQRKFSNLMGELFVKRAGELQVNAQSTVLNDVQQGLRRLQEQIPEGDLGDDELEKIAQKLRVDVVEKIKAHSRELWAIKGAKPPALRLLPMIGVAIGQLRYSAGFFMAFYGLAGIGNLSSAVGPLEALWRVSLTLGVIWIADFGYRRVLLKKTNPSPLANLTYLLVLGVIVLFPMGLAGYFLSASAWGFIYLIPLVILTASIPVLESTLRISQDVRDELLSDIIDLRDSGISVHSSGSEGQRYSNLALASYLHNSLQAELQSIAHALERAASQPEHVGLGRASLERIRALASKSLDEEFETFLDLPLEHLRKVIEAWAGILSIQLNWEDAESHFGNPKMVTVVQIIEEVASNAVTHGEATFLQVSVSSEDADFVIQISSDGRNVSSSKPGSGVIWLEGFVDEQTQFDSTPPPESLRFRV